MQTPAMGTRLRLGLVLVALTGWPAVAGAQGQSATVLSIGDGDTIRVRQAGKAMTVRLACIDAPELAQSPWGQQARSHLQQRLPIGREVTLEVKSIDRYGRSVAEVISEININLAMVEDGHAFAYRRYLGGCDAREYLEAEDRASRRRYGLWQERGHHPPLGLSPQPPFRGDSRWRHSRWAGLSLERDRLLRPCPAVAGARAYRPRWRW